MEYIFDFAFTLRFLCALAVGHVQRALCLVGRDKRAVVAFVGSVDWLRILTQQNNGLTMCLVDRTVCKCVLSQWPHHLLLELDVIWNETNLCDSVTHSFLTSHSLSTTSPGTSNTHTHQIGKKGEGKYVNQFENRLVHCHHMIQIHRHTFKATFLPIFHGGVENDDDVKFWIKPTMHSVWFQLLCYCRRHQRYNCPYRNCVFWCNVCVSIVYARRTKWVRIQWPINVCGRNSRSEYGQWRLICLGGERTFDTQMAFNWIHLPYNNNNSGWWLWRMRWRHAHCISRCVLFLVRPRLWLHIKLKLCIRFDCNMQMNAELRAFFIVSSSAHFLCDNIKRMRMEIRKKLRSGKCVIRSNFDDFVVAAFAFTYEQTDINTFRMKSTPMYRCTRTHAIDWDGIYCIGCRRRRTTTPCKDLNKKWIEASTLRVTLHFRLLLMAIWLRHSSLHHSNLPVESIPQAQISFELN